MAARGGDGLAAVDRARIAVVARERRPRLAAPRKAGVADRTGVAVEAGRAVEPRAEHTVARGGLAAVGRAVLAVVAVARQTRAAPRERVAHVGDRAGQAVVAGRADQALMGAAEQRVAVVGRARVGVVAGDCEQRQAAGNALRPVARVPRGNGGVARPRLVDAAAGLAAVGGARVGVAAVARQGNALSVDALPAALTGIGGHARRAGGRRFVDAAALLAMRIGARIAVVAGRGRHDAAAVGAAEARGAGVAGACAGARLSGVVDGTRLVHAKAGLGLAAVGRAGVAVVAGQPEAHALAGVAPVGDGTRIAVVARLQDRRVLAAAGRAQVCGAGAGVIAGGRIGHEHATAGRRLAAVARARDTVVADAGRAAALARLAAGIEHTRVARVARNVAQGRRLALPGDAGGGAAGSGAPEGRDALGVARAGGGGGGGLATTGGQRKPRSKQQDALDAHAAPPPAQHASHLPIRAGRASPGAREAGRQQRPGIRFRWGRRPGRPHRPQAIRPRPVRGTRLRVRAARPGSRGPAVARRRRARGCPARWPRRG